MRGRIGGSGGGLVPHQNWSAGSAGGALSKSGSFDTVRPLNASDFSGAPIGREKKPVAKAVNKTTSFKMPDMMAGAATAIGLSMGLNAVADSMDRIQQQEQQLERLPQTLTDGKAAYIELNNAATQVRSDGDAFISTYTNMATATEKLGMTQAQTTKATQGLVSALQLGGGSKQAVTNALYQMGQAFSSDRFGGDEFRSFMEAIGTQAPAVAKAFGTDVKGLRAMSTEGKLTAETMVKAFEKMADQNIELLNKQGWTWGQVTTVMTNDWNTFLATATSSGEWSRLMSYIANNIAPGFRDAEQTVAKFWATTTDESKANILLGILGAIGAGFLALAAPVLAATWPFIALGVAVWGVFEIFQEFQHWLDGSAKTMFDSMFGSFDEFEKRYPNIAAGLKKLVEMSNSVKTNMEDVSKNAQDMSAKGIGGKGDSNPLTFNPGSIDSLGKVGSMILGFIDNTIGMPQQLKDLPLLPPALTQGGKQTNINNTNSGNTSIQVATPEDAAKVANQRDAAFITQYGGGGLDNMAEASGAI
ncbi:hypothetical protein D3C71_1202090 [compost metagenome]